MLSQDKMLGFFTGCFRKQLGLPVERLQDKIIHLLRIHKKTYNKNLPQTGLFCDEVLLKVVWKSVSLLGSYTNTFLKPFFIRRDFTFSNTSIIFDMCRYGRNEACISPSQSLSVSLSFSFVESVMVFESNELVHTIRPLFLLKPSP